jgi:hypothetical protein
VEIELEVAPIFWLDEQLVNREIETRTVKQIFRKLIIEF